MNISHINSLNKGTTSTIVLIGVVIAIFATLQDYIDDVYREYAFYWYESLLWKSYLLLFIPIFLFIRKIESENNIKKAKIAGVTSLVHIITFAIIITSISFFAFESYYTLTWSLQKSFFDYFLRTLIIYGVLVATKPISNSLYKNTPIKNISIRNGSCVDLVPVNEILFIKADRPYLSVVTSKRSWLYGCTLKDLHKKLDPTKFVRVHKSSLVNLDFIIGIKSRK